MIIVSCKFFCPKYGKPPPQSFYSLVFPCDVTPESNIRIMRVKEMNINKRSSGLLTSSPGQHHRKCIENSLENMYTDVRV